MNFSEYIPLAMRTLSPLAIDQIEHANLGLISELGELADLVKKTYAYGKPFDAVNLLEEVGDLLWYTALYFHETGHAVQQEALDAAVSSMNSEPSLYTHVDAMARMVADLLGKDSDQALVLHCLLASFASMLQQHGFNLEQAMAVNIAKLSLRYGDKFSDQAALVRNLQAERQLLVEGTRA